MNTVSTVLIALIIIVALLLVLIIMVQNPKGGGISATFGGGGASMGGVQNTNTFLDKSTWTLAAVMVGLILLINFTLPKRGRAVDTGTNVKNTIENRLDDAPVKSTPVENKEEETK